jgi:hypothetical protein
MLVGIGTMKVPDLCWTRTSAPGSLTTLLLHPPRRRNGALHLPPPLRLMSPAMLLCYRDRVDVADDVASVIAWGLVIVLTVSVSASCILPWKQACAASIYAMP